MKAGEARSVTMWLVDASVVIAGFERSHGASTRVFDELKNGNSRLAILDFTLKEIRHVEKRKLDAALSKARVVPVGVSPGEWSREKVFERLVDPALARLVADPSDAVLAAAAEKFNAGIVTRDRRHLYTSKLWNYLEARKIEVVEPHEWVERFSTSGRRR